MDSSGAVVVRDLGSDTERLEAIGNCIPFLVLGPKTLGVYPAEP